jgi:hypothetical protein
MHRCASPRLADKGRDWAGLRFPEVLPSKLQQHNVGSSPTTGYNCLESQEIVHFRLQVTAHFMPMQPPRQSHGKQSIAVINKILVRDRK